MDRVDGIAGGDDKRHVLQSGPVPRKVTRFEGGVEIEIGSRLTTFAAVAELIGVIAKQFEPH